MRKTYEQDRIEQLQSMIEVKEAELAHCANRHKEIAAWPTRNIIAQRRFLARLKTEMHQLANELNAMKTELWGLQELEASRLSPVW